MRVLVVTVVHTPLDARIHRRQITALLDAGHEVVHAAPFTGYGVRPGDVDSRLAVIDLPRARRWSRLRALLAARRVLAGHVGDVDVALVHDPELLLAVWGRTRRLPVVWDVHEDLAASFDDKPWVPRWAGRILRRVVHSGEAWAERHLTLLLAEEGYASRFDREHLVVPNLPPLPPSTRGPLDDRLVYVGRVSRLRGGLELAAVGEMLAVHGLTIDVVGPIDADVMSALEAAQEAGHVRLHGFLPNDAAFALMDGALAGLSLLHDHPNYRHSLPTKVVEYQALGLPVITTPLPAAAAVVEAAGSGVVVPFRDAQAVVDAALRLSRDRSWAASLGAAGRTDAASGRSWDAVAPRFVAAVEAASHLEA